MRSASVLGLLLLVSCGYRLVDPAAADQPAIMVPVTVNNTEWRGAEADITRSLRRNLEAQLGLPLAASGGQDLVLHTRISEIHRNASVLNRQGGATLGSTRLRIDWQLVDLAGEEQVAGFVGRELEFLTGAGERAETALAEIFEDLAEQIVMEVGSHLTRPAHQT